ncbi:MAG: CvpA family protein [Chitinophagales bacterium]
MIIDIIYAFILLFAVIHGFRKGLIHSIVSLIALIIGLMVAVHFSELAATYLEKWLHISGAYVPLIAFVLVFILIYLLFRLLERAMEGFFKLLQLNFINKLAGALVWGLVWSLLYSTILFYINNMQLLGTNQKADSLVFEKIEPLAPKTIEGIGKVIPPVKNIYHSMDEWFAQLHQETMPAENSTTNDPAAR